MLRHLTLNRIFSYAAVGGMLIFISLVEPRMNALVKLVLSLWGINALFAVGFTLIYGYAGQFSLAHAGLAAIGAYTFALMTLSPDAKATMFIIKSPIWPINVAHLPFLPAILLAGVMAAIMGLLVGAPTLRLRGDYLCMATLGFSELIRLTIANLPNITNGALGLRGIERQANLTMIWAIAAVGIFIVSRLVGGSYGRAILAVREDETAAEAMGINLFYHKMLAFIVSSFLVGLGGALLGQAIGSIDPPSFTSRLTYGVITMAVLGSAGSITGAVMAAGIYTVASELLRTVESPRVILGIALPGIPGMRILVFSLALLILIIYYRRGLMNDTEFSWDRLFAWVRSWGRPLARIRSKLFKGQSL